MAENVKTAHPSTGSAASFAILPARMIRLHQTPGTFRAVTRERFRVTACTVFLAEIVIHSGLLTSEIAAQPPLQSPDKQVLTEAVATGVEPPDEDEPTFLTGRAFEDALGKSLSLLWQGQNLRAGLQQLAANRNVAILIDRRLDPGQQLSLQVKTITLRALLNLIATEVGADVSILGNVVYIGPRETAFRLRTVEEMLSAGLVSGNSSPVGTESSTSSKTRRSFELLERQTLDWPDLTTPRELLDEIGRRYSLKIESLDQVPHDLWGKATLPSATPTQMLLAVLAQFDLSFEWTTTRDGIRIIKMPAEPRIERRFTLRSGTESDIVNQLKRRMPGLEPRVSSRRITVTGTVEQLESVEALIHPERAKPRPTGRKTGGGIVTFTFGDTNASLKAFMATLQQQADFEFKYDANAFEKAGIRLDRKFTLSAKELTAEELFHALFDPRKIEFRIDGKTVQLTPAAR